MKADRLSSATLARGIAAGAPKTKVLQAHTAAQALNQLRRMRFSLAMVGTDLPDMDGLELIRRIIHERCAHHVVAVVDQRNPCIDYLADQLQMDGVIDARIETEATLCAALRKILSGRRVFSPQPRAGSVHEVDVFRRLTPRELGVLTIIGCGSDNAETAARLGISEHTVQTHRRQIMRKLRIKSRAELIRSALGCGVVRIMDRKIFFPGLACVRVLEQRLVACDRS